MDMPVETAEGSEPDPSACLSPRSEWSDDHLGDQVVVVGLQNVQNGLGHLLGRDGAVGPAHAGHLEELGGDGARIDAGHLDAVVA